MTISQGKNKQINKIIIQKKAVEETSRKKYKTRY